MTGESPAVQLRLGFEAPSAPLRLTVTVSGMTAAACPPPGLEGAALAHLAAIGVNGKMDEVRGILFPVRELRLLAELPENVSVATPGPSAVLWGLVKDPPDEDLPVRVSHDTADVLNLSWVVGGVELNEPLPAALAPALTALEVPLVASGETWSSLLAAARWIAVVGRCRLNVDGFIEITTSVPQQLEMCPIPTLFRLSSTHYGCPVSALPALESTSGIVWEGSKPALPSQQAPEPDNVPPSFSQELSRSLGLVLTNAQGSTRSRVLSSLVTEMGLGVLVMTLSCHLLEWKLLVARLGLDDSSVRVASYEDFELPPGDWGSVVFDRCDTVVSSPEFTAARAAHSVDGNVGLLRVALVDTPPVDQGALAEMMSLVRPVEFRPDVPVALRYPAPAQERFAAHAQTYFRLLDFDGDTAVATHTTTLGEDLSSLEGGLRPDQALEAALRQNSYGTDLHVSPKVAVGVELARLCASRGDRTLVLTRFKETQILLLALLRRDGATAEPAGSSSAAIEILLLDDPWTGRPEFDSIVLMDYPWSGSQILDYLRDRQGTFLHVVHALGGVDDALARFTSHPNSAAPTIEGARWLLDNYSQP